jgi:hypothetical protein
LEQIDFDGKTTLYGPKTIFLDPFTVHTNSLPENYALSQNYPNPFNPITKIGFGLPKDDLVKISIYNILGQLIKLITHRNYYAGYHTLLWDGRDRNNNQVQSGIYYYQIETGEFCDVKKMVLLK